MKFFAKLKSLRTKLRDPYWRARKRYIKYFDTLPIKERAVLVESQHGREMSGNVFYILKYLLSSERYRDFEIYLSAREGKLKQFEEKLEFYGIKRVKPVVLASDEYYRLMASAKYLINDNTFLPFFIKKEGQIYLNTWHGTPLKTLGKRIKADAHAIGNAQKNFVAADYILAPNKHTSDALVRDYMIENIARGSLIFGGYPRNEALLNQERAMEIRGELNISDKRIYAFMPTFRGTAAKGGTPKNTHYLNYYLYELDSRLADDEILYVNLHPVAKKDVDFRAFTHIRNFPSEYETYDFLSACDVLVSDYSSVFFDYAASRKKVVLFTYDKEEYLRDRGMYLSIDELPFPQVTGVDSLLAELRSQRAYCDGEFLEEFAKYECPDATARLCDTVILGEDRGLEVRKIPSNGKENVLIYTGNLAGNGITASLFSLMSALDPEKKNYYLTFRAESVYKNRDMLEKIPDGFNYFATSDDMNLTVGEQIYRKLFKSKLASAKAYAKRLDRRIKQSLLRSYGGARFDAAIQFNGYESEVILQFAKADGKRTIFVHNDMIKEIKSKGNQRLDVLKYAYNAYDSVAVVTEDMIAPTFKISDRRDNIKVVKNTINYKRILEKAEEEFTEDSFVKCSVDFATARAALESDGMKFINVGRFAPEKGQDTLIDAFAKFRESTPDSYLFIIGGYSLSGVYERLEEKIRGLGLTERVILLFNMQNPYPVLKKCDYFVLSSLYEGFGLVLAEADILGLPVISTDIPGPKLFMEKHGGTLVECSEAGILLGMKMLADGRIPVMGVDYEKYNNEAIAQFESLFK